MVVQFTRFTNEFGKAKTVLNELVKINPRYGKAAPLIKAINEKLNIN